MMERSGEILALVESCQRHSNRLWWGALAVSGAGWALGVFWQFERLSLAPTSLASLIGLFAVTSISPHLVIRIGLRRKHLSESMRRPISVDHLPLSSETSRRVLEKPIRIDVQFRHLITKAHAESIPENEQPLLHLLQLIVRWNVVRLWVALVGGTWLALCLDPTAAGGHRSVLFVAWVVAFVTYFPRITEWFAAVATSD